MLGSPLPIIMLTIIAVVFLTTTTSSFESEVSVSADDGPANIVTKKLSILLLSSEVSTGHVVPVLAVGEELVRRGHTVSLCSTYVANKKDRLRKMAEKVGVSFMAAGPSSSTGSTDLKEDKGGLGFALQKMQADVNTVSAFLFAESIDETNLKHFDFVLYADLMHFVAMCINHRYNTPVLLISTMAEVYSDAEPSWPWPNTMAGDFSDNLSFWNRLRIFLIQSVLTPVMEIKLAAELSKPVLDYCPNMSSQLSPTPYFPAIYPTVIGFEYSRTIWPMSTYVGPLLTKSPDPLPEVLKRWLDAKRKRSVVYISMGSHINILKETGQAFIDGILKTHYDAIWALRKENQDILEGITFDQKRIFIIKWAPQLSIVQHKAISMAIVHGGFNGIHESLYSGVPLIVVPLMLHTDQTGNAARVRYQGLGVTLDFKSLTAEKITSSINEIDSGDYRRNVERLQKIFISAGGVEKAADLVEYYKDVGFDHLIPAYAKYEWSWVQYYNVDVYGLLAVILVSVIYCSLKCCQCVWRRACLKRKQKRD